MTRKRKTIIDNRYRILKKLGVGATGIVYKVRDLKNNNVLALKILSRQKTSSEAVQRFKREFRLLAGLHHPNLCSVYDFGMLNDGRSYFTMDYIDGQDIFKATKGLSYKEIYPWIVELCRALEYIHAKGLIHYDVKPGNILIQRLSDNNTVKLTDFGLAGEQRIKGGTLIKGTFPYIAPEVIKGLTVDHRADLYSLGVLLYEMFTRKPFQEEEESFVTLLQQRIRRGSALPSNIIADIPKRLEQLLVQLFAFEPAVRLSRANEVIVEINKLSRSKYAIETEKTIEGYLLSSRFVGRDREMELLTSFYERAHKGEGNIVLVIGDAGIGKSRLIKEFKIITQLRRSHCFIGYAYKDKIAPLEPFYDIFGELINYINDESAISLFKNIKFSLAVLFKIFPDLASKHFKKNLPKLASLGPQQEKLRNFEALSELLRFCAKVLGEFVILLEDLHWADDLTIQFLEYLGRNVADRNILICSTSRKQELKENQALKKMIFNLSNTGYFTQIELGPLRFKSLYSFLDSTITPNSNSSELVRYLMKKTGGNPFFVEEIMRSLLKKRSVSIGEHIEITYFREITLPETIEDVVLKRVEDLDQDSQMVIKFAAVLLRDFTYDLMKRLTRLDDTELSRALWELKSRQILIEEDTKYRFYHATLREAINKHMAYREKRKLYYQTGRILELIYKRNTEGVVEDLAFYFINAKDRTKGIRYSLQAAKKSSARYANEQTIRFYKGALGLLSSKNSNLRFNILQELIKAELFDDRYNDAIKHYNELLSFKIRTIAKKSNIYLGLGQVYWKRGEHIKALRIYQKADRSLRKMRTGKLKTLLEAYINVRICRAHQVMGDYKRARKFNFDSLKLPHGIETPKSIRLQAEIYYNLHIIEINKGKYDQADFDKAIFYCNKAYTYFKKEKNEDGIAAFFNNLGVFYHKTFEFQKALSYYQKAIKIWKKIGVHSGVATALYNFGNISRSKGDYSRSSNYLQKALLISEKIGNPSLTADLYFELGNCFLALCNHKKAREYLEEAKKISDEINWEEKKYYSIQALGNIYRAIGDYSLAIKYYKKALKFFSAIKHQQGLVDSFVNIGSVFIELGQFSKSKTYIKDALQIANAIGSKNMVVECYIHLCRMNIMLKDYAESINHYKKGMKIARQIKMKRLMLWFLVLGSQIYYCEKEYLKGLKHANKATKLAKEMGTKDLYVEALLIKATNGFKEGILSRKEVATILDKAIKVAEETDYPEVLCRVYSTCGRFFKENKKHQKASRYYQKCIEIFRDVVNKIKDENHKRNYLNRPDRRAIFTAIRRM